MTNNRALIEEYYEAYNQMVADCDGESAGWYGWIGFDLVKRMAERLDELEAEPSPLDKLNQGYERLGESRPLIQPKQYGRRSVYDE